VSRHCIEKDGESVEHHCTSEPHIEARPYPEW